ncbi:sugar phosphate isomerase/epimerase [Microbacteriaceae bacterium VKM Ac-2854]|nr:sugar phosphate isomerase/epimerase [Microbacteriaceae bacterium VKM Ac-2854]
MTTPRISIQLYTVKDALAADLDGTVARLAGLGLATVEAFDFVRRPEELVSVFAANGVTAPTAHANLLSDDVRFGDTVIVPPSLGEVFAAAQAIGIGTVFDPMTSPERWATVEGVQDLARRMNAAAKAAAEFGIRVGYHNHAQEFTASFDGISAYEYFVSLLDDGIVLELDTFWAATGGVDVEALIRRLGERVVALHIKDGVPGVNPFLPDTTGFDPSQLVQRAAGRGELPVAAYLDAATALEYAVIEFDYVPGDVFGPIAETISHLKGLGLS